MIFKLNLLAALTLVNTHSQSQCEHITRTPYAVTSFQGLEEMYLRLRNADPQPESPLTEKSKWTICEKIFQRDKYLLSPWQEILLHPTSIQATLRDQFQSIFEDIFEESPLTKFLANWNIDLDANLRYQCVNRSKPRPIYLGETEYTENVFVCLVRVSTHESYGDIKQYYVSDNDYNVNVVAEGEHIVGRFVFTPNRENKLVIHALAEESSAPFYELLKLHYLQKRNDYSPTHSAEEDPLCRLNDNEKLRLCTAVLMDEFRIWPVTVRVEEECVKRSFSFSEESNDETSFDEWMIACKKIAVNSYVSRSYSNNEVFVYKFSETGLKLHHYRRKISVVKDIPIIFKLDDVED